jgi:hypothetical protein
LESRARLIYRFSIRNQRAFNGGIPSRRLLSVAAGVAVCLAASPSWQARTATAGEPRAVAMVSPPPLANLPAFRLGTAARWLGLATAVGDFDTDGTPDLAIADRVPHATGTSSFTIEFAVSGLESRTVAFESNQDALTVRVSDVDHDDDLDVVVSAALSREVVGVWLNDGSGGFEPAAAITFASEIESRHALDGRSPSSAASVAETAPRSAPGMPSLVRWTAAIPRRSSVSVRPAGLQPALLSSAVSSRAPPRSAPQPPSRKFRDT